MEQYKSNPSKALDFDSAMDEIERDWCLKTSQKKTITPSERPSIFIPLQ
jgi:hypothetical protein